MSPTLKWLPGRLSITQPSNAESDERPYVEIEVRDVGSATRFLKVRVDAAEMMRALGHRMVECSFEVRGLEKVGTKLETKHETIWFAQHSMATHEHALRREILRAYELDGWQADLDSAVNHHNRKVRQDGSYDVTVTFRRWVQP